MCPTRICRTFNRPSCLWCAHTAHGHLFSVVTAFSLILAFATRTPAERITSAEIRIEASGFCARHDMEAPSLRGLCAVEARDYRRCSHHRHVALILGHVCWCVLVVAHIWVPEVGRGRKVTDDPGPRAQRNRLALKNCDGVTVLPTLQLIRAHSSPS